MAETVRIELTTLPPEGSALPLRYVSLVTKGYSFAALRRRVVRRTRTQPLNRLVVGKPFIIFFVVVRTEQYEIAEVIDFG